MVKVISFAFLHAKGAYSTGNTIGATFFHSKITVHSGGEQQKVQTWADEKPELALYHPRYDCPHYWLIYYDLTWHLFKKRRNLDKAALKVLSINEKLTIIKPRQRLESQPSEVLGAAVFKEVELKMCLFLQFLIIL